MKIYKSLQILVVSSLFMGCSYTVQNEQDILSDRLSQERIYTVIKNYSDLIKINKEKLQKQDIPDNRIALADNYYNINDYDSALYYIEPLLRQGKDSRAFLLKGKILESKGQYEKAFLYADTSIKLDPKNAQAYNLIGIIKTKTKKFSEAKENFLKAKSLFLEDNIVNNNLGMLYIAAENYNEAINYLLPLYNRNFKEPKIINNLVLALVKANRDEEALAIINKEGISKNQTAFIHAIKKAKIKKDL